MSTLKSLYRTIILDHYKKPRHHGLKDDLTYTHIHLSNPSCGDSLTVGVKLEAGRIKDVRHEGSGCSICCASASVMSTLLTGKTKNEGLDLSLEFSKMILGKEIDKDVLDEAIAFEGVRDFPARMKCATLAWKAFEKALKEDEDARK